MATTFDAWLRAQTKRQDLVGDLARDAANDSRFPTSADYYDYHDHLTANGASAGAVRALNLAWREWQGEK